MSSVSEAKLAFEMPSSLSGGPLCRLPRVTWIRGMVWRVDASNPSLCFLSCYSPRLNAVDFHTNKRVIDEVAIVPSKRLRNKIAGFTTHLMRRIQKGPVRGISFKLQEEERERKVSIVIINHGHF